MSPVAEINGLWIDGKRVSMIARNSGGGLRMTLIHYSERMIFLHILFVRIFLFVHRKHLPITKIQGLV